MIDVVEQTLRLWRTTPFDWGTADCLLSIGQYLVDRGQPDHTGQFRGTYDDEAGALAHVIAYGGVMGILDLTGLRRIDDPTAQELERGDIVALRTTGVEVGALCTGNGIAARLERGVIEIEKRFLTIPYVWKVR